MIDLIWYLKSSLGKTTEDVIEIIIDISSENLLLLKQEAESISRYTYEIYYLPELSNQIVCFQKESAVGNCTYKSLQAPDGT